MLRGKVKWFHDLKGYGFIAAKEIPERVYVRFSDIQASGYRTLKKGDEVFFELIASPDGAKAANVIKI